MAFFVVFFVFKKKDLWKDNKKKERKGLPLIKLLNHIANKR